MYVSLQNIVLIQIPVIFHLSTYTFGTHSVKSKNLLKQWICQDQMNNKLSLMTE